MEVCVEREGIRRLLTGHRWRLLAANSVHSPEGTPARLIGGLCRRALWRLGIDGAIGWVREAERACSFLARGDVDVVLASGPMFSAFPLARRLAKRLQCPYVLDYRDLWSQHLHKPMPAAFRLEAAVLTASAAVTTVSPSWGLVLDREFQVGAKLHIISNGYDAEELAKVEPHDFGHFAIVYTGSLWPPKRVITPLMVALRALNERIQRVEREQWKFHYYGRHGSHVQEEADRIGVGTHVVVHGEVPRSEALAAVKGAGIAAVITSIAETATLEDAGMVTGKLFEAVGLGTPTLLIAPRGSDAEPIAKTTGLVERFAANDVSGITSFLESRLRGHALEAKDPAAYSWGTLVSSFDRVLRDAILDHSRGMASS